MHWLLAPWHTQVVKLQEVVLLIPPQVLHTATLHLIHANDPWEGSGPRPRATAAGVVEPGGTGRSKKRDQRRAERA